MTKEEIIHIYENSRLTSEHFTEDALTAVYVAGLSALHSQQAPAKLDRSRWRSWLDGCPFCWEPDCNCCAYAARREELEPCKSCVKGYQESEGMDAPGYVTANYCHHCGRPLTEEAWAELERKIGDNDGTIHKKSKNGKVYVTNTANICFADRPVQERLFCVQCQGPTDRGKCGPLAVIDRLAAYEDTGLEPEEIVALTVEPPNNPLTLEELRERNGKPIWSESLDGSMQSKWMICTYYMYDLKLYGKKWVAYLREPGEVKM